MFTPSDIVVLILLAGSAILIWIARRASFAHREDAPKPHDHESPCSAEHLEVHGETKNHTGSCQSKENDSSCNSK
jgi:cytoskeletal protein RodZ